MDKNITKNESSFNFISYFPPPKNLSNDCLNQYEERLKYINEDLESLLRLGNKEFQQQAINNQTLKTLIDFYLRYSPRAYEFEKIRKLPESVRSEHFSLHKLVLKFYFKIVNNDNNTTILDLNFYFETRKLLNLCVLYQDNAILNKIISIYFFDSSKDIKYFKNFLSAVYSALIDIKSKFNSFYGILDMGAAAATSVIDNAKFNENNGILYSTLIAENFKSLSHILLVIIEIVIGLNTISEIQLHLRRHLSELNDCIDILKQTLYDSELLITCLSEEINKKNQFTICYLEIIKFEIKKLFSKLEINFESFVSTKHLAQEIAKFESMSVNKENLIAQQLKAKEIQVKAETKINRVDLNTLIEMFPTYDVEYMKQRYLKLEKNIEHTINYLLTEKIPKTAIINEKESSKSSKSKTKTKTVEEPKKPIVKNIPGYTTFYDFDYEDEYDDTYGENMDHIHLAEQETEDDFKIKPLNEKLETKKWELYEDDEENTEQENLKQGAGGRYTDRPQQQQQHYQQKPAHLAQPKQYTNNSGRNYENSYKKPIPENETKEERERRYARKEREGDHHNRRKAASQKMNRLLN